LLCPAAWPYAHRARTRAWYQDGWTGKHVFLLLQSAGHPYPPLIESSARCPWKALQPPHTFRQYWFPRLHLYKCAMSPTQTGRSAFLQNSVPGIGANGGATPAADPACVRPPVLYLSYEHPPAPPPTY